MILDLCAIELHRTQFEKQQQEASDKVKEAEILVKRKQRDETEYSGKLKYSSANMGVDEKKQCETLLATAKADLAANEEQLQLRSQEKADAEYVLEQLKALYDEKINAMRMVLGPNVAPGAEKSSTPRMSGNKNGTSISSFRDAVGRLVAELLEMQQLKFVIHDCVEDDVPHYSSWEQRTAATIFQAKGKIQSVFQSLKQILNETSEAFAALASDQGLWGTFVAWVDEAFLHTLIKSVQRAMWMYARQASGRHSHEMFTVNLKLGSNCRTVLVPAANDLAKNVIDTIEKVFGVCPDNKLSDLVSVPTGLPNGRGTIQAALEKDSQIADSRAAIKKALNTIPEKIADAIVQLEERHQYLWGPDMAAMDSKQLKHSLNDFDDSVADRVPIDNTVVLNRFPLKDSVLSMGLVQLKRVHEAEMKAVLSDEAIESQLAQPTLQGALQTTFDVKNPPSYKVDVGKILAKAYSRPQGSGLGTRSSNSARPPSGSTRTVAQIAASGASAVAPAAASTPAPQSSAHAKKEPAPAQPTPAAKAAPAPAPAPRKEEPKSTPAETRPAMKSASPPNTPTAPSTTKSEAPPARFTYSSQAKSSTQAADPPRSRSPTEPMIVEVTTKQPTKPTSEPPAMRRSPSFEEQPRRQSPNETPAPQPQEKPKKAVPQAERASPVEPVKPAVEERQRSPSPKQPAEAAPMTLAPAPDPSPRPSTTPVGTRASIDRSSQQPPQSMTPNKLPSTSQQRAGSQDPSTVHSSQSAEVLKTSVAENKQSSATVQQPQRLSGSSNPTHDSASPQGRQVWATPEKKEPEQTSTSLRGQVSPTRELSSFEASRSTAESSPTTAQMYAQIRPGSGSYQQGQNKALVGLAAERLERPGSNSGRNNRLGSATIVRPGSGSSNFALGGSPYARGRLGSANKNRTDIVAMQPQQLSRPGTGERRGSGGSSGPSTPQRDVNATPTKGNSPGSKPPTPYSMRRSPNSGDSPGHNEEASAYGQRAKPRRIIPVEKGDEDIISRLLQRERESLERLKQQREAAEQRQAQQRKEQRQMLRQEIRTSSNSPPPAGRSLPSVQQPPGTPKQQIQQEEPSTPTSLSGTQRREKEQRELENQLEQRLENEMRRRAEQQQREREERERVQKLQEEREHQRREEERQAEIQRRREEAERNAPPPPASNTTLSNTSFDGTDRASTTPSPPLVGGSQAAFVRRPSDANKEESALRRKLSLPPVAPRGAESVDLASTTKAPSVEPVRTADSGEPPVAIGRKPSTAPAGQTTPRDKARSARAGLDDDSGNKSLLDEYRGYCQEFGIKPNSGLLKILPKTAGEFVTSINLDLNYIGVKGVQPLLQILKRNRGLRLLNLKDNNLENAEVRALVGVLMTESGDCLEHLDLSNNPISLAGGSALMDLVTKQKSLTKVVLRGTLVQPKVVDRIVAAAEANSSA